MTTPKPEATMPAIAEALVAEATLVATIAVLPDDRTTCRLVFAPNTRFMDGEVAVRRAIAAMQAEHAARVDCPASGKGRGKAPVLRGVSPTEAAKIAHLLREAAAGHARDRSDDLIDGLLKLAADSVVAAASDAEHLRAELAALRADPTAGDRGSGAQDRLAAIRAEMPETLNTGNLVHDVRTLRYAHDSVKDIRDRWGRALKLLLPFVDFAAGEGLMFTGDDEAPPMDAADLCVAFSAEMRCELGDAGYMAMLRAGQDAIRALAAAQAGTPAPSPLHPHAEGNGHG